MHVQPAIHPVRNALRVDVQHIGGIDAELLSRDEVRRRLPYLDYSDRARFPVEGAIFQARDEIAAVRVTEPMEDYIVALVAATRRPAVFSEDLAKYIQVGVSPRGSLALDKVSRAHAWLDGRDQVTPDDIRAVINDCLRHRIVPSFEAQADGVTTDDIVAMVVKLVAVA